MRYIFYLFVLLLCGGVTANAQQFLTGKVYVKGSSDTLISVSIHNITEQRYDLSDEDGSYRIQAAPGDHISFSSVGHKTDTITVTASILTADYPVYLEIRPQTLQAVRVEYNNYQLDSMDRRKEYSWVYDHGNTPRLDPARKGDGVGVNMNIFRHSGSPEKQRERLEKRLLKEEEDYYVDFRYNKDYVARITHLKGDSLKAFMKKYRPSYEYCRKAATVDILVYINDCYKQFMKPAD
ncbi:MAG TPA: hypothetical protein VFE32_22580 [Puia sp.]|jgi:hypothetical protein|nr:hypothetical protein [Puia sp.]